LIPLVFSLAATRALANRLQCRTPCKIENGRQRGPKMKKGHNREEKKKKITEIPA